MSIHNLTKPTRRQKRLIKGSEKQFAKIVKKFFEECINKKSKTIQSYYKIHDIAWQYVVRQANSSKKENFLHTDAFENAIKINGYRRIMDSEASWGDKKEMIRIVDCLSNRSRFYKFIRFMSNFGKIIETIKKDIKKRKYGVPKMENPPPPPEKKLQVV